MGASCSEEYQPTEGWAVSRYPRSCPEPLELVDLKFYWSSMRLLLQRDESWNDGRTPSALARGVSEIAHTPPCSCSIIVYSVRLRPWLFLRFLSRASIASYFC